mmetsp:Transcript_18581/g.52546  ORF Transcript_18581/g.52546 Transcript_18581/m.52546 type:complete len:117 (-) Transcript_18581:147-497(-)
MDYKEFLSLMLDGGVRQLFEKRNIQFREAKMVHAMLAKPVPGQDPAEDWRRAVNRADFLEACMRLKHDHLVLDSVKEKTALRGYMDGLQEQCDNLTSSLAKLGVQLDGMACRQPRP